MWTSNTPYTLAYVTAMWEILFYSQRPSTFLASSLTGSSSDCGVRNDEIPLPVLVNSQEIPLMPQFFCVSVTGIFRQYYISVQ